MKKGFTMIELIFVIVILGILASVAIPRLSGTREDAEISAAVANLRTLLGDVASYYAVKGDFKDRAGTADAKWQDLTSVPLEGANGTAVSTAATAHLKVGGVNDCIGVHIVGKTDTAPAYIKFTKKAAGSTTDVCQRVITSKPVAAYLESKVNNGSTDGIANAMAISSNTKIY